MLVQNETFTGENPPPKTTGLLCYDFREHSSAPKRRIRFSQQIARIRTMSRFGCFCCHLQRPKVLQVENGAISSEFVEEA